MISSQGSVYGIALGPPGVEGGGVAELGFKAFNLRRLAESRLPVPQAFVLGTDWCARYQGDREATRAALRETLPAWIRRLEQASGLVFGGDRRPLLVSVRSGAPVSMPGMMDTILDVGLTQRTVRGLMRLTGNPRLAWDSYRRLVQQYAEIVHGADAGPYEELLGEAAAKARVANARELDFDSLRNLTMRCQALFEEQSGRPFPQQPWEQLENAVLAVLDSWQSRRAREYRRLQGIGEACGTAVTVQRMVFGNCGGNSGSGVGFTRDPSTGENRLYLDFVSNAQGEDVVSGRHAITNRAQLSQLLPEVSARLDALRGELEAQFGEAQEFEFTVQEGSLYILQTRTAKCSPWAALRIAVDQVTEGLVSPARALERLGSMDLAAIERRRLAVPGVPALAAAEPASIGLATGVIALDAAACARFVKAGRAPILVRGETSTEDIGAIALASGVLTARGGRTSHAAVVARQLGKVCLVGCTALQLNEKARSIQLGDRVLREGETICLDAERGAVYEGAPEVLVERPAELLERVRAWREAVAVRA
ncbi:MAG TPA: PEP/pyruvate-binding domain-containing protein [Usitatibacter sp.]|nr:PEP/pyruvate-binding domain-containing protein [Usitatibacter sp.]